MAIVLLWMQRYHTPESQENLSLSPNGIHRECRQLCHFSDSHGARSAVWALGHVKRIHSGLLGLESRAWKIGLPGWASYKFRAVAMFMAVALEACREIA